MKLRCWPGCIARVDYSDAPENIGKLVEVLRRDDWNGEPAWACRTLSKMLGFNALSLFRFSIPPAKEIGCCDKNLTPITPPKDSVSDEEVRELYQPGPRVTEPEAA